MHCTERCPECPSRDQSLGQKRLVSGDYNTGPHKILFVGEAPGREENNRGRVFCGKAGDEFNQTYLPLAGLSRQEISITNTVKCHWADSSDAPPPALIKSCAEFHLRRELAAHDPEYVVLMGSVANSLLGLDIEFEHGMMRVNQELLGWRGTVFSTYHPALGLHESSAMLAMIDKEDGDFPRLRLLLRGQLQPLKDEYPNPEFARLTTAKQVRSVMGQYRYWEPVAVDTESRKEWQGYPGTERYYPWCATWCHETGAAYMVRCVDEDAYREFCEQLGQFTTVYMHNAPHDHEVIASSGYYLPWRHIHDTLDMAYNDGKLRKGLKWLSYRLLGKRMVSFDETVVPHSRMRALDYLEQAMAIAWPKPLQEPTGDIATRKCPECKGTSVVSIGRGKLKKQYPCDCGCGIVWLPKMTRKQSVNDKLWRLATDMSKNPYGVDLWQRWNGWVEAEPIGMETVIHKLGPIPIPSIEFVPEEEAITYACGDAHETLRIYPILRQRLTNLRRSVQA